MTYRVILQQHAIEDPDDAFAWAVRKAPATSTRPSKPAGLATHTMLRGSFVKKARQRLKTISPRGEMPIVFTDPLDSGVGRRSSLLQVMEGTGTKVALSLGSLRNAFRGNQLQRRTANGVCLLRGLCGNCVRVGINRGWGGFRVDRRVTTMIEQPVNGEGGDRSVDGSERAAIERLLRLARSARLFRAGDGRLFARVPVENRSEVYALRSGAFPRLVDRRAFPRVRCSAVRPMEPSAA